MQWPGRTRWEQKGPFVRVGNVRVPRRVVFEALGDNGYPDIKMRFEVRDGRPDCTEVAVRAKPDGRGLRTGDMSAISIDSYVQNVFAEVAQPDAGANVPFLLHAMAAAVDNDPAHEQQARRQLDKAQLGRPRKIDRALLSEVARVYRENIDGAPTMAVAAWLRETTGRSVTARTAGLYVRRARDAELLPPTTPGKRKA